MKYDAAMLQTTMCVAGVCAEVEMGKKPATVTSATAHAESKRYEPISAILNH